MSVSAVASSDFIYHQAQFVELMRHDFAVDPSAADGSAADAPLLETVDGDQALRVGYFSIPSDEAAQRQRMIQWQKYGGGGCLGISLVSYLAGSLFFNCGTVPTIAYVLTGACSTASAIGLMIRGDSQENNDASYLEFEDSLCAKVATLQSQQGRLVAVGAVFQAIYGAELSLPAADDSVAGNLDRRIAVLINDLHDCDVEFDRSAANPTGAVVSADHLAKRCIKLLVMSLYFSHMKRHPASQEGYRAFVERHVAAIRTGLQRYLTDKYQFAYSALQLTVRDGYVML